MGPRINKKGDDLLHYETSWVDSVTRPLVHLITESVLQKIYFQNRNMMANQSTLPSELSAV